MTDIPSDEHLREEVQKVASAADENPPEIPLEAVQAALETSNVDVEGMDQGEYDNLFQQTRTRMHRLLANSADEIWIEPPQTADREWDD